MSDSTNIMRQYMEAIPRRDFDRIRQLFHPQYSYTGGDGQRQEGPEAGVAVAQMYTAAFPDLKLDVKHMHAAGDDVVITEFIVRATHQGELMGIAPTGRKVEYPCYFLPTFRPFGTNAHRDATRPIGAKCR